MGILNIFFRKTAQETETIKSRYEITKGKPCIAKKPSASTIIPELALLKSGEKFFIPNTFGSQWPVITLLDIMDYRDETNLPIRGAYTKDGMWVWRE